MATNRKFFELRNGLKAGKCIIPFEFTKGHQTDSNRKIYKECIDLKIHNKQEKNVCATEVSGLTNKLESFGVCLPEGVSIKKNKVMKRKRTKKKNNSSSSTRQTKKNNRTNSQDKKEKKQDETKQEEKKQSKQESNIVLEYPDAPSGWVGPLKDTYIQDFTKKLHVKYKYNIKNKSDEDRLKEINNIFKISDSLEGDTDFVADNVKGFTIRTQGKPKGKIELRGHKNINKKAVLNPSPNNEISYVKEKFYTK